MTLTSSDRSRRRHSPSLGEEIANSVSHGVGLVAALAATPFLLLETARRGDVTARAGVAVFAATVVILYLASTLYHALPQNTAKRVFRVIDHSAIFLLIAGTYTPFTLGILRGAWGGRSSAWCGPLRSSVSRWAGSTPSRSR